MKKYDDDNIPPGNTWNETRNLWPLDLKLRANGFQIQARPKRGPALWSKDGAVFTQEQALESCTKVPVR